MVGLVVDRGRRKRSAHDLGLLVDAAVFDVVGLGGRWLGVGGEWPEVVSMSDC